ncbi:MAG: hypothetical protein M3Q36_03505 [bacterium]|nr:hypothetical protein [bacterium]
MKTQLPSSEIGTGFGPDLGMVAPNNQADANINREQAQNPLDELDSILRIEAGLPRDRILGEVRIVNLSRALEQLGVLSAEPGEDESLAMRESAAKIVGAGLTLEHLANQDINPFVPIGLLLKEFEDEKGVKTVLAWKDDLRDRSLSIKPDAIIAGDSDFSSWAGGIHRKSFLTADGRQQVATSFQAIEAYASQDEMQLPELEPYALNMFISNEGVVFGVRHNSHRVAIAKLRGEPVRFTSMVVYDARKNTEAIKNPYDKIFDPENHDLIPLKVEAINLDERQKELFAPYKEEELPDSTVEVYSRLFDKEFVDSRYVEGAAVRPSKSCRVPTAESLSAALNVISGPIDPRIKELVVGGAEELRDTVRNNGEVREALAGYLLAKIGKVPHMPHRVTFNEPKSPNVPGYATYKIPGQEYAVLLALSMLDGSFQGDGADTILMHGKTAEQGQHRFAARLLLSR